MDFSRRRWSEMSPVLHIGLALSLLCLAGCPKPPPPELKPTPPPPIVMEPPVVGGELFHELLFSCGKSHPGLSLEYVLLDESGKTLKLDRLRVGAIFDARRPLEAGVERVIRITRPEDLIKVVGGPRPRSPLDRPALDLQRIHSARLRHVLRCEQQEWVWNPGMELPPEVEAREVPEPGTVFIRNVCPGKVVQGPVLQRTFRYRRRHDPGRAWIDLKTRYNIGYPSGLTFKVSLLDAAGKSVLRPGCSLQLRQPPVLPGTVSEYRIEFDGVAAVRRAWRIKSAAMSDLVTDAGSAREATLEQICH